VIGPSICTDGNRVAAFIIRVPDQDAANAHFAERDFLNAFHGRGLVAVEPSGLRLRPRIGQAEDARPLTPAVVPGFAAWLAKERRLQLPDRALQRVASRFYYLQDHAAFPAFMLSR
jgi:hypothetical protein